MFDPDVVHFKENYLFDEKKMHDSKYNVLNYEMIIDLNDIFTFQISQQVYDRYQNSYEVYLHVFLEEIESLQSPIVK